MTRGKNQHYIVIKISIHQEDTTIINTYAPNNRVPLKYIMQTLTNLKEETDNSTIILKYINNPLSIMDRTTRQKINRETKD